MQSLHDLSMSKRKWSMSMSVRVYIKVMCSTKHQIQAAKQALRQPNKKAEHTPWAGKWRRAKQDREQNIVQIGRALHRAMSEHDPVHIWARTTKHCTNTEQNSWGISKERCAWAVRYSSSCVSCVSLWKRCDLVCDQTSCVRLLCVPLSCATQKTA